MNKNKKSFTGMFIVAAEIQTKHETECRIIVRLVGIILNNVKSTKFKEDFSLQGR